MLLLCYQPLAFAALSRSAVRRTGSMYLTYGISKDLSGVAASARGLAAKHASTMAKTPPATIISQ
jgi:hypothetical protein